MVRVIGDRVLVERITEPTPASTLIEVVSLNDTPSQFCRVVAVGNGRRLKDGSRLSIPLETGQTIVTNPYCGTPMIVEERELFIVVEDDILGVVYDDC